MQQHLIDPKIDSKQVLTQGRDPDQGEEHAEQPRERTEAPIGQAEEPIPAAITPAAAFGFMTVRVGRWPDTADRSNCQPMSTKAPMAAASSAKTRATNNAIRVPRGAGSAIFVETSANRLPHPNITGTSAEGLYGVQ